MWSALFDPWDVLHLIKSGRTEDEAAPPPRGRPARRPDRLVRPQPLIWARQPHDPRIHARLALT
ncbi:hypothetical protein GCM10010390_25110 [Streptomyces mordarskii]|uniref:Uncharacterized protein n=1 Tax=Streptomyces mordarskii TaxID=1226758 RepID=A0ABN1CM11_9ACTN